MSNAIKHPSLLAHFRSFCVQNNATDLEVAIRYFAVFGATGWNVDLSVPLDLLIEEKVLRNYRYIHGDIAKVTQSKPSYHALLSALASGDRREHSAFKKANLKREDGEEAIDFLIDANILYFEKPMEKPLKENENASDKLGFHQAFMRFWFVAISPYYKGIKENDYSEMKAHWVNIQEHFTQLIYEQLLQEVIKKSFDTDPIVSIGAYWDKYVSLDILAKRKSGKWVAGSFKHSKAKASKSELNKLKERCKEAQLDIDAFVMYSKNKFSSELKKEKGEKLKLLSVRNMQSLLDKLSDKELLSYENKKY
jgi:hypothetical protein